MQRGDSFQYDDFAKQDGVLDPSLFIIISGGEKRERDYFDFFKKYSKIFPRIEVEFICEDSKGRKGLDVLSLVTRAHEIKDIKKESIGDDIIDTINIVTDVDDFYPQIKEKLSECKKNNLNLIISNPCFEIWLYYSCNENMPNYILPKDKSKISKSLKVHLNEVVSGGVDPRKAPWEIYQANKNSLKNYKEDKTKIPKLFSTQMHVLGSKLYELLKDDIERLKDIQENKKFKMIEEQKKLKRKN